jgi:hypothetical protein
VAGGFSPLFEASAGFPTAKANPGEEPTEAKSGKGGREGVAELFMRVGFFIFRVVLSPYIGPQNVLQEREAGSGAPDTGQESRTPKGGDPGQLGFS